MSPEEEIRLTCHMAKLDDLADEVVASGMSGADTRRLCLYVVAFIDQAVSSGALPEMKELEAAPESVAAKARALVVAKLAESIEHRTPKGRPN